MREKLKPSYRNLFEIETSKKVAQRVFKRLMCVALD